MKKTLELLNIPAQWEHTKGGGVRVAVIDAATHFDRVPFVIPVNYDPREESHWHGSSVCEIIHQIAPDAEIYSLQWYQGGWNFSECLQWCIDNNIDIVNMSLSTFGSSKNVRLIKEAYNKGVILVSSAGNEGYDDADNNSEVTWPAEMDGVIAVAGYTHDLRHSNYSSGGAEVLTTGIGSIEMLPPHKPQHISGTSFSSPQVAGMLALVKSVIPELTPQLAMEFIKQHSRDLETPARDELSGYGVFVMPDPKEWMPEKEEKPMAKVTVIDGGHGGKDPGAVGPTSTQEKDVTLSISKRVAEILQASGMDARLTRDTDKHFSTNLSTDLSERAKIANNAGADVFVSIHCNSSTNWSVTGTETHHFPGSIEGAKLAGCLQKSLVAALGTRDRKVKGSNFAVLRETNMPSALVELAFISNPQEEERLRDPVSQEKAAHAIAKGIADYLGITLVLPASNVFTDVPQDHWAVASIERLAKDGIMAGYQDDTFKPEDVVTRAQLAVVVDRVLRMSGR